VKSAPALAVPAVVWYDAVTPQPRAAPFGVVRRTVRLAVPTASPTFMDQVVIATDGRVVLALAAPSS
jgi:hypothetical protein